MNVNEIRLNLIFDLHRLKERSPEIGGRSLIDYEDIIRVIYKYLPMESEDK